MKLSEMRQLLAARGIQLTKSLGQNFLHDGNQLRRIVEAADLTPTDKVMEIGPGLGPLTEMLVARAGEVLAIEKDARLVQALKERLARDVEARDRTLEIVCADALEFLRSQARDWSDWKLVANLPYSVASAILVELAQSARRPERMVVTLQLEVARRLMARAGDTDYGVLTLLVQLDYQAQRWFKIPAGCFFPEPDVDSACVALARRAEPLLAETARRTFVRLVKRAFSQRRKMMLKLLREDWPAGRLLPVWRAVGLPETARAEQVTLEQFAELAARLASD